MEYSSRKCYLIDEKGEPWGIDLPEYNFTQNLFSNHKYSVNKIKTYSHGYTTIGDKYNRAGHGHKHTVDWPLTWNTSRPLVSLHTYEDRLHTLSSWRNYTKEEVKSLGLFVYPEVNNYKTRSILGANFPLSETYAKYLNGRYGAVKKIRLWILVFDNKDRGIADEQEIYWKGGHKNEFVIMMNKGPDGMLNWAHIMSPTEVDSLKIEIRDKLTLTPFQIDDDSMLTFLKEIEPLIVAKYVKPDYRQYAYIEVVPSIMAIVLSYSIILLINIGIGIFVVKNDWHDHHGPELTTAQAAENVANTFRTLIYEILKALGIIKLMDKMSGNKKTSLLTEGDTLGGMSPKSYYRPTERPIFPPPHPLRPIKGKPWEATNTKPIRRKRRLH